MNIFWPNLKENREGEAPAPRRVVLWRAFQFREEHASRLKKEEERVKEWWNGEGDGRL